MAQHEACRQRRVRHYIAVCIVERAISRKVDVPGRGSGSAAGWLSAWDSGTPARLESSSAARAACCTPCKTKVQALADSSGSALLSLPMPATFDRGLRKDGSLMYECKQGKAADRRDR